MNASPASFYILFSAKLDKYYCGITTEEVHSRLDKHNSSFYGAHYTSIASDWIVSLVIPCDSYKMARQMELYVKRMKSRRFIEKIIHDKTQTELLIETIGRI